jgi:hypothetical protein
MKINLSDYFPILPEELKEFAQLVESSREQPPEGGFESLMATKEANEKLTSFQDGRAIPRSIGMLVEILALAVGKNKFRLAGELQVDNSAWSKVILDQCRPDTFPARIYATLAKTYNVSIEVLKNALEGSFRLLQSGVPIQGAVYASSDRISAKISSVPTAMYQLLQHSGKTEIPLDQKAVDFIKEIETCMKI